MDKQHILHEASVLPLNHGGCLELLDFLSLDSRKLHNVTVSIVEIKLPTSDSARIYISITTIICAKSIISTFHD